MAYLLLVADDEEYNLDLIRDYLTGEPYELVEAMDGAEALEKLSRRASDFHCAILDRMMPRLDGLEVLRRMKADPALSRIPVVMQTAMSAPEQVAEGLDAGAFYYLGKPYTRSVMRSVIGNALRHGDFLRTASTEIESHGAMMRLLDRGQFRFRTLAEARMLAAAIASLCPRPQAVLLGLSELVVNAIEHGVAGIGYAEKSHLLTRGAWEEEVERRLADPTYAARGARLSIERAPGELVIRVEDDGEGFAWKRYAEIDPARAFDAHGRGIAMARMIAFQSLDYEGRGNVAVARVALEA